MFLLVCSPDVWSKLYVKTSDHLQSKPDFKMSWGRKWATQCTMLCCVTNECDTLASRKKYCGKPLRQYLRWPKEWNKTPGHHNEVWCLWNDRMSTSDLYVTHERWDRVKMVLKNKHTYWTESAILLFPRPTLSLISNNHINNNREISVLHFCVKHAV